MDKFYCEECGCELEDDNILCDECDEALNSDEDDEYNECLPAYSQASWYS